MIESIHISGVATYAAEPEVLNELSKFNFVYGSNGSGKTTVSRVIANEINHPTCRVTWRRGTKLIAMVYNRDFEPRISVRPPRSKASSPWEKRMPTRSRKSRLLRPS